MAILVSIRPYVVVLAMLVFASTPCVFAQDSPWAEGQELVVTRYTYLPNGRVLANTTLETVERSRNPLVSVSFIGTQGGIIKPKSAEEKALRIGAAKEILDLGYNADWQYFTYQDLASITLRIRKANELKAAGVAVDWHDHQAWQLLEMLDVVHLERQLGELGVVLTPKVTDASRLRDILARVRKARDLETKGVKVDWRQHSYDEMVDLEARKARK
ncbi:MAG: hypothetical protein WBQ66_14720 [Blastocatellia bacterium]|jgi:hypothetical protein